MSFAAPGAGPAAAPLHPHADGPMDTLAAPSPDIRRWLPAAYFFAVLLCISPFIEVAGALWPPDFSSPAWRYGAVGIFLSFVGTAPIGLLLAIGAATVLRHRVALRIAGVAAILLALLILIVCGAFALDVVQVRPIVRPQVRGGFDIAAAKAMAMGLLIMLTSVLLAIAAFRAAAPEPAFRERSTKRGPDLVVGSQTSPLERP